MCDYSFGRGSGEPVDDEESVDKLWTHHVDDELSDEVLDDHDDAVPLFGESGSSLEDDIADEDDPPTRRGTSMTDPLDEFDDGFSDESF